MCNVVRIDRFEINEVTCQDGTRTSYRVWDPQLEREVALTAEVGTSRQSATRFLHAAAKAGKLNHPNIAAVLDAGRCDTWLFVATDYIQGDSLHKFISKHTVAVPDAVRIVKAVAQALHYAHELGVTHDHLSTDNIKIHSDGSVVVTGFGVPPAVPCERPDHLSATSQEERCAQFDQWSIGAVFYELLHGQAVPTGGEVVVLPATSQGRNLHPDVRAICLRCLQVDGRRGYENCGQVADDLHRWERSETTSARPLGPVGRSIRWCERNPMVASLAGIILVVTSLMALGLFGVALFSTVERALLARRYTRSQELRDAAERQLAVAQEAKQKVSTLLTQLQRENAHIDKLTQDSDEVEKELAAITKEVAAANDAIASRLERLKAVEASLLELGADSLREEEKAAEAEKRAKVADKVIRDSTLEYAQLLHLVNGSLASGRYDRALLYLHRCRFEDRDWSWRHLYSSIAFENYKRQGLVIRQVDEPQDFSFDVSTDSKWLVTRNEIWNTSTSQRVSEFHELQNVRQMMFSPNSQHLCIRTQDAVYLVSRATPDSSDWGPVKKIEISIGRTAPPFLFDDTGEYIFVYRQAKRTNSQSYFAVELADGKVMPGSEVSRRPPELPNPFVLLDKNGMWGARPTDEFLRNAMAGKITAPFLNIFRATKVFTNRTADVIATLSGLPVSFSEDSNYLLVASDVGGHHALEVVDLRSMPPTAMMRIGEVSAVMGDRGGHIIRVDHEWRDVWYWSDRNTLERFEMLPGALRMEQEAASANDELRGLAAFRLGMYERSSAQELQSIIEADDVSLVRQRAAVGLALCSPDGLGTSNRPLLRAAATSDPLPAIRATALASLYDADDEQLGRIVDGFQSNPPSLDTNVAKLLRIWQLPNQGELP